MMITFKTYLKFSWWLVNNNGYKENKLKLIRQSFLIPNKIWIWKKNFERKLRIEDGGKSAHHLKSRRQWLLWEIQDFDEGMEGLDWKIWEKNLRRFGKINELERELFLFYFQEKLMNGQQSLGDCL